jgi:hypothetical protein
MSIKFILQPDALSAKERKALESRLAKDDAGQATETIQEFAERVALDNTKLAEYVSQDEAEDKRRFGRVVEVAFLLSDDSRQQVLALIHSCATAEGIDTSGFPTE